jgi:DNA-directed RNA polymerase specialized sigma24 family protein
MYAGGRNLMPINGFDDIKRALESFLLGSRDNGTKHSFQYFNKVARFQVLTYNLLAQDKDALVQFMFDKKLLMKEAELREKIEAADLREEGLVHATASLLHSLRHVGLEYSRSERKHHHAPLEASQTEVESIERFRDDEVQRHLRSLLDAAGAQLSEKDQQTFDTVLVPHVVQGFSFEELGETLGEKPNLLRCRVSRLLPKLRKMLLEMI